MDQKSLQSNELSSLLDRLGKVAQSHNDSRYEEIAALGKQVANLRDVEASKSFLEHVDQLDIDLGSSFVSWRTIDVLINSLIKPPKF